jgi:hypothetical protein
MAARPGWIAAAVTNNVELGEKLVRITRRDL